MNKDGEKIVISVIGLGYVGLPVAAAFGRKFSTVGFDINTQRITELKNGFDRTGEVDGADLSKLKIVFTDSSEDLKRANFHIVAVPTPLTEAKQPDLTPLLRASETVGKILKKGDIVVYESTVYPGATEEDCLPILERESGLKGGVDFTVGYSPERINPGDREHSFTKIKKVVSGQNERTLETVAQVYGAVVEAGIHKAESIRVAEAAKVIENTQRDLNISLVNELALIFDQMGIDTSAVLKAAGTKWNFLGFRPGLVGGHCIGVDPYYLTHKAEKLGYHPQVILAGRRINDGMGKFIAQKTIKELIHSDHSIKGNRVTVLGLTFKENCPDLRNTRVVDIVRELQEYGIEVQVSDPIADREDALREYGLNLIPFDELKPAAAVVVAVAHKEFMSLNEDSLGKLLTNRPVLIDVKDIFSGRQLKLPDLRIWHL